MMPLKQLMQDDPVEKAPEAESKKDAGGNGKACSLSRVLSIHVASGT
jgi:hypothetical protein